MLRERALTGARRLCYSITWRVQRVVHWVWGRLLLAPRVRRRHGVRGRIDVQPTHTGVIIRCPEVVLKASPGRSAALQGEYDSYRRAVETWPPLRRALIPLEIEKDRFATCLVMSRCEPIVDPDAALDRAVALYELIGSCGFKTSSGFDLLDTAQIRCGMEAVAALFGGQLRARLEARVQRLSSAIRVGFAHGDFHSRNIMIDMGGDVRLIDLDCIRTSGVQQFDALNFVLEAEWSRSGRKWTEQLPAYVRGDVPTRARNELDRFGVSCTPEMALGYLVDRVGQERLRYGFRYRYGDLAASMAWLRGVQNDRAH